MFSFLFKISALSIVYIMLTLSTCFYIVKSKFNVEKYKEWMYNLLHNVNNFNLVIYTNEASYSVFSPFQDIINNNSKILIVFRELEDFYMYKYRDSWIYNQKNNSLLNYIDWELQMIWAEKIFFVDHTIKNKYYDTQWYGWCDIGYFRNRTARDMPSYLLKNWPNHSKINILNKDRIYYARVNNDNNYFWNIIKMAMNKNDTGLPLIPLPNDQVTIAGGFFICHKEKLDWWKEQFNSTLKLYFDNSYLVKDDQIIIISCIANNYKHFELIQERDGLFDNWFLFQRYLL